MSYAAKFAQENGAPQIDDAEVEAAEREALAPLSRDPGADVGPYRLQSELQALMQDKAGIAREDEGLAEAQEELKKLKARAEAMGSGGKRDYNPGWHTALDLHNLMTDFRSSRDGCKGSPREPRSALTNRSSREEERVEYVQPRDRKG